MATAKVGHRSPVQGDRFIPAQRDYTALFGLHGADHRAHQDRHKSTSPVYRNVLRSEVRASVDEGDNGNSSSLSASPRSGVLQFGPHDPPSRKRRPTSASAPTLSSPPSPTRNNQPTPIPTTPPSRFQAPTTPPSFTCASPLKPRTVQIISDKPVPKRKIPQSPYKILPALNIQDDFYLHLLDWSSSNVIAVGLESGVMCWSRCTRKVARVYNLNDVASVHWLQPKDHLLIGSRRGKVTLWDVEKQMRISTYFGHTGRVGVMSSTSTLFSSGSRDRTILTRDPRVPDEASIVSKFTSHKQEVCGLKWSPDEKFLASGGNDNNVYLWSPSRSSPLAKFSEHKAAVKALAWSPHSRGVLATGGGTADRTIRFWNTNDSQCLKWYDTGSQVSNLAWSVTSDELVSTHGYSQNQIVVWSLPSMTPVATLLGHTSRVLYMSSSPDGQSIATAAGDGTLRLWKVFPPKTPTNPNRQESTRYLTIR